MLRRTPPESGQGPAVSQGTRGIRDALTGLPLRESRLRDIEDRGELDLTDPGFLPPQLRRTVGQCCAGRLDQGEVASVHG